MVGCVTLLLVAGFVTYQYRTQIAGTIRSVREGPISAGSADAPTVGTPSDDALRSARRKERAIGERGGPAFVVLTADEMASLVWDGLDPAARAAIDSLRVTLDEDRFILEAMLRTRVFGRDLLGPLGGVLAEREPLRVAGPARYRNVGVVAWEPNTFAIRAFPFPQVVVPRLVNRLTGRTDGSLPLAVPETVDDVRVRPGGVTFYRRMD